jgi:hypothetical protein
LIKLYCSINNCFQILRLQIDHAYPECNVGVELVPVQDECLVDVYVWLISLFLLSLLIIFKHLLHCFDLASGRNQPDEEQRQQLTARFDCYQFPKLSQVLLCHAVKVVHKVAKLRTDKRAEVQETCQQGEHG